MTEHMTFGSLDIAFDEQVLRPREWTVAQSNWAEKLLDELPTGPVLELCAGAGQIGLLAVARSERELVCVDLNTIACQHAAANASAAGMAHRVEIRNGRLEESVRSDESFPLVIADPPWVPRHRVGQFPEDPVVAIDGGGDGLDVARACLRVVDRHLAPGGSAIFQLGTWDQAAVLEADPVVSDSDLSVVEVQQHVRGVLVRIVRPT